MLPGVTLIPTKPVKVESVPILSFYFLARPIRRGVGRTLRRCKKETPVSRVYLRYLGTLRKVDSNSEWERR